MASNEKNKYEYGNLEIFSNIFLKTPIIEDKELLKLKNEELFIMCQEGNESAFAALLEKNKYFIYKKVKRKSEQYNKVVEAEDLFNESVIHIINKIKKFDGKLKYAFLTYCGYWIKQASTKYIKNKGYSIRFPVRLTDHIIMLEKYERNYPSLSPDELVQLICDKEDLKKYDVIYYFTLKYRMRNLTSLYTLVGEKKDTELIGYISDEQEKSVEDQIIYNKNLDRVYKIYGTLTYKEKEVLRYRYGLDNSGTMTLEQIGDILEVSAERIRQIEAEALDKMRNGLKLVTVKPQPHTTPPQTMR